jgi:hypothetical protein
VSREVFAKCMQVDLRRVVVGVEGTIGILSSRTMAGKSCYAQLRMLGLKENRV